MIFVLIDDCDVDSAMLFLKLKWASVGINMH